MSRAASSGITTKPLLPKDSPFQPQQIDGVELRGGENDLVLAYVALDEVRVRVHFEGLDSYRAARGKFSPYWSESNDDRSVVAIVVGSPWLIERHAYEAEHYGADYEWGRGADTMLTDTHHFFFRFHDGFVEVLARAATFERPSDTSTRPVRLPS